MNILDDFSIGPRTLNKLDSLGITTIKELALTHAYQLVGAGIGKTTVKKLLKNARKTFMDIQGFNNHDAERFVLNGADFQDAIILSKIQKQLSKYNGGYYSMRALSNFDTRLDFYIGVYNSQEEIGIGEYVDKKDKIYNNRLDFWYSFAGIFYKLDKGKVILLWYHPHYGSFPVLKKIPEDLLELSHLKYSCILCTHRAIERMPENIRSNNKFEVKIESVETGVTDFDQLINEVGAEVKIIRREMLNGYDNELDLLIKEAFIRKDL